MELELGNKVPVAWHLGADNYAAGDYHPGTVIIGPEQGGKVVATSEFTDGRGAILIAQPTAGPWEAGLVDGLDTLQGEGGSSHFWMSPSICDDQQIERWVIAMGRDGLNELGQDLSGAGIYDPYHQEGATPGYGHVLYGDDGREPRFFKTENFAGKSVDQQSMLLVELVQYISDDILHATVAYPSFNRNLTGGGSVASYLESARAWCTKNSIAIINDYLTGCGSGDRGGATTTTTTTRAATTTTTTGAIPCNCYALTNATADDITLIYVDCDGARATISVLANSSNQTVCARSYDDHGGLTVTNKGTGCGYDEMKNQWDCCPVYNIGYTAGTKSITVGCATQFDVITLAISHSAFGQLTLGTDYNISYPGPNGCLTVTLINIPAGTFRFVINGCTYTYLFGG